MWLHSEEEASVVGGRGEPRAHGTRHVQLQPQVDPHTRIHCRNFLQLQSTGNIQNYLILVTLLSLILNLLIFICFII